MKELFRERDVVRVELYRSILESEGIPTHIKNRDLVTMVTDVPIPEFFPALCVVDDEDHAAALAILLEHQDLDGDNTGDIPFETRGVFLAGIVLICLIAFAASLGGFMLNIRFIHDANPPYGAMISSAIGMLLSLFVVVIVWRNYRASHRRRQP